MILKNLESIKKKNMESNQLDQNEILVKPEVITEWKQLCESPDEDGQKVAKIWRYHELWFITIVMNESVKKLCKDEERMRKMFKFFSWMLNDQEFFLTHFYFILKNKIWKGSKDPKTLPIDLDRIDYLHVNYKVEKQPFAGTNFLHAHISVQIVHRPTRGLTMCFNTEIINEMANRLFGHNIKIDFEYTHNPVTTVLFYIDKNVRGELK